MSGIAALAMLKRFWWSIPLIGLAIALALAHRNAAHWQQRFDGEHEARLQVAANYKAFATEVRLKAEEITRRAAERNRRVEAEQQQAGQEKDGEIRRRIDAAVAAVRLRANAASGTDPGRSRNTVPRTADPALGPAGAGEASDLSTADQVSCAEAVVKAEGWQEWWSAVAAIRR